MLLTFAALLALAALLFWPRDGDRALGRDNPGIAERDEEATPPEAATVAPEMFEARFVLLDTAAREGPDGTTAPVRQLTRGERVEVLASGGAEQAPEGWFRLQGGGYVVAEALRATAPPPLTRRLDEEMTLQSQTDIYNGPELAGPVQRTLARGQRVRVVGLVNQDVAEVRVGMDLGYAAYLSLLRREENPAALPPPQAQTSPRVWPPPQIPAPDARSPAGAGLVLGAADLVRAPSGEAMADYYPRRAFRERVEAQVAIQCNVIRSGRLTDCRVSRESPAGFGFGEATIRMAQETFRAPQRTRDGRPTEGAEFRATVRWRMP
ncbi:MAG: energy transducer TonB [Alphaproteobacteria bacterium]|nr:energy transducer TonB [Alphaproteobacteria bacterium]